VVIAVTARPDPDSYTAHTARAIADAPTDMDAAVLWRAALLTTRPVDPVQVLSAAITLGRPQAIVAARHVLGPKFISPSQQGEVLHHLLGEVSDRHLGNLIGIFIGLLIDEKLLSPQTIWRPSGQEYDNLAMALWH
jgi:hypothetical protein